MLYRLIAAASVVTLLGCTPDPEAAIRKNLAERMPTLPKIDQVSKTPVAGIYEVRFGQDVIYTDARGDHIIEGTVFDTRAKQNLTELRIAELTRIDFATLPLQDAIVVKQGSGARKVAVFADPNCVYCKTFERDLRTMKDVTVYTFLYPVLGIDSDEKSRQIWCSKDAAASWRGWMLENKAPARLLGPCDTAALARNVAFGRKHKLDGTPAVVFEDGRRARGALPADVLEKRLAQASAKS
jgi:thiol:disulfide interchange protein DsbC